MSKQTFIHHASRALSGAKLIPAASAVLILLWACGWQNSKTQAAEAARNDSGYAAKTETGAATAAGIQRAAGGGKAEDVEQKITRDILSLPEMRFEHAAVEIVSAPSDGEPYYTVKGGSNTETHFAASLWFHVYTEPDYEIRVYDVATDAEMTLQQWRDSREETLAEAYLAHVKFDAELPGGRLRLLVDRLLWIDGDDTETLLKYGFDPDDVANDYELYNEKEEWIPLTASAETAYRVVRYDDEGVPAGYHDVDAAAFRQYIAGKFVYDSHDDRVEHAILAKVSVADGIVLSVGEVYVP